MPMFGMLSKRERGIATVAALVLGGLLLYWLVVQPLLSWHDRLATKTESIQQDQKKASALVRTSRDMTGRWNQIRAAGYQDSASAAESQLQNAVGAWAAETGLALSQIQPERGKAKSDLQELPFEVMGSGSMRVVVAFLHRVETADLPVRMREVQISPKREGLDDLSVKVKISTLCGATETRSPGPPALSAAPRKEEP